MTKPPLTPEARETIAGLVREDLALRFTDAEFVFDPIVVLPEDNLYGDPEDTTEYVNVLIVFDGDQKMLDAEWTGGMNVRIIPKLEQAGYPYFPIRTFIGKKTWQKSASRYLRESP